VDCNVVHFCRSPPMFRRNIWPPSSGSESNLSKELAISWLRTVLSSDIIGKEAMI
jgi:hypothetical protein